MNRPDGDELEADELEADELETNTRDPRAWLRRSIAEDLDRQGGRRLSERDAPYSGVFR
jgi:hypothetical protein